MTTVPLKTELKKTTVVSEDGRDSTLNMECGERISLVEEDGHRQEVRTYERRVELRESIVREGSSLKKEIRHQMVLTKDEDEVSTWYNEEQQVEPLEDIKSAFTENEAEKLEDTDSQDKEDFDPEDKAVDQREEMFLSSPPLKESAPMTPSPEKTRPTKKEIPQLTSKKEALVYTDADIPLTYAEQKEVTESFLLVHHEEETVFPMEHLIKPKISATCKEITVLKKPGLPKEVTLMKQVSPLPDQDLPQILPKTVLSCPMTAVPPKQEVITPKKSASPREHITMTSKTAGKMYPEDIEPLERPTPESEVTFEHVPATVSPPVPVRIPSPEKVVCVEKEILPSNESVLLTKKTYQAIPKAVTGPEEDFPPEEVSLLKTSTTKDKVAPTKPSQVPRQKKPLLLEETLQSKKSASLAQKIVTPKVYPSEEARTATTEPQSTRDDKEAKKERQETELQTLQKGILFYLSRQARDRFKINPSLKRFNL